ncbi:hypothetical protein PLESTF_001846800 [Pleodorina starrii]|nr:hypothetical protein PLESTM_000349400 [Pleodorina starrii]GLC76840.1 hypothetical protein PLESTF_001846800 [Pleodorina starrii]
MSNKKKAERQACEMDKSGKPAAMETDSDPFSGASKAAVLPPARESIRPLLVAAAPQPAAAGASITYASVLPVLQQMPTSPVSLGLSNHTEIIANVAGGTIACKSSPHGLTAASAAAPAPPTRPRTPSPDRHEPVGPREPLSQPRELQAQLQLHHLHHPDYRQPHHLQPIFPSPTTRLVRQAEVKWNSATTVAWCGPAAGSSNTALPPYNPVYISRPAANRQHGFVGHPTEPPPPQPVYYMLQPVRVAAFSSQSRPQYPEPVHDSGSFEPVTPARARPSASYKPYMAPPASYMAPPAPYMAPPAAGHFLDLPCRSELAVSRSAAAAAVPLVVTETQCGSQLRPPEWVVAVEDGGFLDALLSADQDDADDSCDSSS